MKDDDVVVCFGCEVPFKYLSLPEKITFLNHLGRFKEAKELISRQGVSPKNN